jgi:hypothetical protein
MLHPLVDQWNDEMTALGRASGCFAADWDFCCEQYIWNGNDSDEKTLQDISDMAQTDMDDACCLMNEAESTLRQDIVDINDIIDINDLNDIRQIIVDIKNGRAPPRHRS